MKIPGDGPKIEQSTRISNGFHLIELNEVANWQQNQQTEFYPIWGCPCVAQTEMMNFAVNRGSSYGPKSEDGQTTPRCLRSLGAIPRHPEAVWVHFVVGQQGS